MTHLRPQFFSICTSSLPFFFVYPCCCFYSGAPSARVGGAPLLSKSTHPRKFGNHVTVHRPPVRPHHRTTNVYSHILASLGAQEKTNFTSMLRSIDSCQNRASADQYHLTVARAQVSTHRGRVFFEVIR